MSGTRRARWGLVTTTGVLTGFGHGFAAFAVSALLKPISADLDTGRGAISVAIGLGRLVSGLVSPLVGQITDRKGPRGIVVAGMGTAAVGLIGLAFVRNELELYIAWSLIFSLGVAAGFTVALDKLVVASMPEKRGMGLAVRFSISAILATLIVPVVAAMIEQFGWRQTCAIWGGLMFLLIPVPLIFFPSPQRDRALPGPVQPAQDEPDARSVLRRPAFWLIAAALSAQASVTSGLSVHLVALMTDHGLGPGMAAGIFGGMVLLTVPVRLLAGFLADRIPAARLPLVLSVLLVLEGLAIGSFAVAPGFATMLVVTAALGIAAGAPIVLVLVLCAELFGQSGFGAVQGKLMMIQVPGSMLAPILAGYAHDATGSYVGSIAGFAIILIAGGMVLSNLKAD
ncbi:MFS transporter [Halodurantibacterium flavum]|uniref:MFS transporter n=1 Tax=Halodurantibacterium flavum TaxID=1382802 RepID=A0ABW4S4Y5_9RHOB